MTVILNVVPIIVTWAEFSVKRLFGKKHISPPGLVRLKIILPETNIQ